MLYLASFSVPFRTLTIEQNKQFFSVSQSLIRTAKLSPTDYFLEKTFVQYPIDVFLIV